MIGAMADRPQTVVLIALQRAAESGPQPVRIAAVTAMGKAGNESCTDLLLHIALDPDVDLAKTARSSLVELPGQAVDQDLVGRLHGIRKARSCPF